MVCKRRSQRHKLLNIASGDARRRVQVNQETSKLNGTLQPMVVIYWTKILISKNKTQKLY
jgi:hypothetical protein